MNTGVVRSFSKTKGFGVIMEDGSTRELTFYVSGIIDEISQGDKVCFDIIKGSRGFNAVNVSLLD